jgi:stage III sporulation protein SpoIIIAA
MDKSMLTPTKMQLIEEKRKLIKPLTEDDDLEEVMIKIDRDLRISKEKPPA